MALYIVALGALTKVSVDELCIGESQGPSELEMSEYNPWTW